MECVWVHIHGGTIITAYKLPTFEDAQKFRAKYDATDMETGSPRAVPRMPSGITDDPFADTWILVEGLIEYVDGTEPWTEVWVAPE